MSAKEPSRTRELAGSSRDVYLVVDQVFRRPVCRRRHHAISGRERVTRTGRVGMHQLKSQTTVALLLQCGNTSDERSAAETGESTHLGGPSTTQRRGTDDLPVNVSGDVLSRSSRKDVGFDQCSGLCGVLLGTTQRDPHDCEREAPHWSSLPGHWGPDLVPPNESRLTCGALKKNSFLNLRAPAASSACIVDHLGRPARREGGNHKGKCYQSADNRVSPII